MALTTTLSLAGQVLLGGFFVLASANMLFDAEREARWVEARGLPFASVLVYLVAAGWLVGGAAVIADPFVEPSTLTVGVAVLVPLLLVITPVMHNFWNIAGQDGLSSVKASDGGEVRMLPPQTSETMTFLTNLALVGALLSLL